MQHLLPLPATPPLPFLSALLHQFRINFLPLNPVQNQNQKAKSLLLFRSVPLLFLDRKTIIQCSFPLLLFLISPPTAAYSLLLPVMYQNHRLLGLTSYFPLSLLMKFQGHRLLVTSHFLLFLPFPILYLALYLFPPVALNHHPGHRLPQFQSLSPLSLHTTPQII